MTCVLQNCHCIILASSPCLSYTHAHRGCKILLADEILFWGSSSAKWIWTTWNPRKIIFQPPNKLGTRQMSHGHVVFNWGSSLIKLPCEWENMTIIPSNWEYSIFRQAHNLSRFIQWYPHFIHLTHHYCWLNPLISWRLYKSSVWGSPYFTSQFIMSPYDQTFFWFKSPMFVGKTLLILAMPDFPLDCGYHHFFSRII